MCGIAGAFGSAAQDGTVEEMLERIAHRGPDGRGIYRSGDLALGHVRLSIQDPLPRSDQPYTYGETVITFAGEVWNWREIREELETCGLEFETEGDTETVAAAIDFYGRSEALQLFEGLWTLAVHDRYGDSWLARDTFGKVPLYFHETGGGLLGCEVTWSSERKAWTGDARHLAEPVPPGCVVEFGATTEVFPYTGIAPTGPLTASQVLVNLREGVRTRLRLADVPVCCLISGGLDSSLILALAKEEMPDVVAYCAYADPESPDLLNARKVAAELDVPLREVEVPWPDEEAVREAIRTIEIPMKAQIEIATLCLPLAAQISADGFKVVLSGEGADEIFGGYGGMARRAGSDEEWRETRMVQIEKMARGNFIRTNKTFMRHGVEMRLPFIDRQLIEGVLAHDRQGCPPGKGLLKDAATDIIPSYIIKRQKETFQGAAGVIDHMAGVLDGKQVKRYNEIVREEFGGMVRG